MQWPPASSWTEKGSDNWMETVKKTTWSTDTTFARQGDATGTHRFLLLLVSLLDEIFKSFVVQILFSPFGTLFLFQIFAELREGKQQALKITSPPDELMCTIPKAS